MNSLKVSYETGNEEAPEEASKSLSQFGWDEALWNHGPVVQLNPRCAGKGKPKQPKAKNPKRKTIPKASDLRQKEDLNGCSSIGAPIASGFNVTDLHPFLKQNNTFMDLCRHGPMKNSSPVFKRDMPRSIPAVSDLFASGPKYKKITKWKQINNVSVISIGGLNARSSGKYNWKLQWTSETTTRGDVEQSRFAKKTIEPKPRKKKEKKIKLEVIPTVSFCMKAHLMMKYGEDYDKNLVQMEELLKWSSDDFTDDGVVLEEPTIKQPPQRQKKSKKRNTTEIARKLPMEYVREYNTKLRRIEEKLNGISKVTISLEKFYLTEKGNNLVDYPRYLNFEFKLPKLNSIPYSNLWLLAKHEQHLTKNILKIFPDFRLEMPKTTVGGDLNFDPITTDVVRAVANRSRINGVVGEGKEAVILHACSKELEFAFKVFKLTANSQRNVYLEKHERSELAEKHSFRKYSRLWTEKEKNNLKRMRAAGILCPRVFRWKQNVLMMSFVGKNGKPAPKLKDAVMTKEDYLVAYKQIIEGMELFHKSGLVHADLSENNVLWHNGRCYFIDVSQSVTYEHKHALKFLYRDCNNITEFFSKKQILNQPTADELFHFITGQPYEVKIRGKAKKTFPTY